jgi:hypothetical protein
MSNTGGTPEIQYAMDDGHLTSINTMMGDTKTTATQAHA